MPAPFTTKDYNFWGSFATPDALISSSDSRLTEGAMAWVASKSNHFVFNGTDWLQIDHPERVANAFIFDIEATTEEGNVFNSLDSLAAAVANVTGSKTVHFLMPSSPSSLPGSVSGLLVPNGTSGPYNFSGCQFITNLGSTATLPLYVDFAPGVVFSGMPYRFFGPVINWRFPAGFWTPTEAFNLISVDGTHLYSQPGLTTNAAFVINNGIYVYLYTGSLGAVSGWGDAPATKGLFGIDSTGLVTISLYDQGQVGQKTASGSGYLSVNMGDANCSCENQTLLTGTFDIFSNQHGTIVYDTTSSSYNFIYPSWSVAYKVARNFGLNKDSVIHVNGTAGAIPSGSWDLSNIILTGDPDSVLTIEDGANLSNTTQFRVRGNLKIKLSATASTPPFVWTSNTRTVQIDENAVIENLASVNFMAASSSAQVKIYSLGNRSIPCSTGGAAGGSFISASGFATIDFSGTRYPQCQVLSTSASNVICAMTTELQLKGSTSSGSTSNLEDGLGNSFLKIPQNSTVLLQGTISARGKSFGTANAGSWTFTTMITRDASSSTIVTGGTAIVVSAANYPTAPLWVLDAGSEGIKLQCTGSSSSGVNSYWTSNINITITSTGA